MLKIDTREPDNLKQDLSKLFSANNIATKEEFMDSGDYAFMSVDLEAVVVERKEIHDYLNSLRSGRLMDQLFRILTEGDVDVPILLIEGSFSLNNAGQCKTYKMTTKWNFNSVADFELSAQRQGIIVQRIPSHKHTAQYLLALYQYFQKTMHVALAIPPLPFPSATAKNLRDLKARQFLALPGVGAERTDKLMNKYHCMANLCEAEEKELEEFLGKTTGKRVYRAIHD